MTNKEAIEFLLKVGYEFLEKGHYVKGSTSINLEEKAVANEKGEQMFFKSYTELFSILKEDNNGWIRIDDDGNNLPNEGYFMVYWWDGEVGYVKQHYKTIQNLFQCGLITHYKPITPELKPIY